MNTGVKTTKEEEEQQNELAYKCNGMDKQTKNVQKRLKYPTKIQLHKKLVISVKELKCTVYFSSMF